MECIRLEDMEPGPLLLPATTPITKGYINLRATVWCACGDWEDAEKNNVPAAGRVAKRLGWKFSRAAGWQCPACASK